MSCEKPIPDGEEGLGEVSLDTPTLVVNIMVGGIVGSEMLQGVPGESIAAVIVHSLNSRTGKKPHGLAVSHSSRQERNTGTGSVEEESLHRMVIQSTERIWDV